MRKEKVESILLMFLLALPLFQIGSFLPAGATISFSVDSPIAPNTIAGINVTINEPKGKLAIKNVTTFLGNGLATLTYTGYERVGFLDDDFQDWVPYKVTVEKGDLTRVTIGSDGWGSLDYNLPDDKKFNGFIYRYVVLRISEWTSSNLRFSVREAGDDWKHWATWTGELDPSQDPIIIDIGEKLDGSMIIDGFSFYTDGSAGTGFVVDYVMAVSTTKEMEVAKGKTAFADSIQDADHDATKAVDCNVGTRWASAPSSSNHWLAVDLGEAKTVSLIRVYWEAAYTPTFLLQVKNDGSSWTTLYQFNVSGAGWRNWVITPTTGRYWRIYDNDPDDNPFPNLSIWEFQLYVLEDRWHYRKEHEIVGSSAGSQSNYPIELKICKGPGTDSGDTVYLDGFCREDFGDIRFTAEDGTTQLKYWIEEKIDGDYARFWVEIPNIPADPDTVTIYIYYGDPYATTTASSGDEIFLFFDDFSGSGLDTNKWQHHEGTYYIENSEFKGDGGNSLEYIRTKSFQITGTVKIHFRMRCNVESGDWDGGIGIGDKWVFLDDLDYNFLCIDNNRWWGNSKRITTARSEPTVHHIYEVKLTSTKAYFYDLTQGRQNSYSGNPTGYLWIVNDADGSRKTIIDWILVSKYVDPAPSHGTWGEPENLPVDREPCQFAFESTSGKVLLDSASFIPLNSTAICFSWKVKFTEDCPRGYISLLAKYYNKDNEITECGEPSLLYLLGPSYGVSEIESESKVPHVAVVLWYQGWPVVDIRLVARMLNDTGLDMSHVSVAVDMGRLYPSSGAYDPNYANNVTWLQENFPEMTVYGCNLPTRLSNNPYQEAVDQLDWFYSVFGYYPKFINQFGLGKETYQALEEKGVKIVFSKCFEESSFNASDYRRYRGNEEYGTAATCDEGGLWQPYKPSRRNENIPGANISDQFDLWECGFLSRDLPHAYFDEPFYSNHPADVLALTNYDIEEAKEYLTRLLDMYELNAKWNDVTVMHLSISSTMFFDPDDQNAEARRYLLHWEVAEMLRRGFIFVNAEELADLLDQFETTPTYKWVSSGTFTRMRGGGYLAEGTWKYGTFVAVGNGSGRAIFSVAADYDSVMGGHWIEVCNYTRLSRYSTKWSSIRAPIGTNPYFYTNGTPTGYPPDDQFIPFYRASDGYFYYPNTQLYVLNTSVVVKDNAVYIEVWSTPPPDAPQCYFVEKITVIPSAIIYRVEAIKKENVGTSDIQVCLKGIANPNDNSPDPQVDSKIHIVDSAGNTYTASDTNPNIIIKSKPHKMGDAIFFYAYQNGKKIGAGIYLLTDCDGVYVADQPGSKGAVTYQLEGLKAPYNSKKTAPLEIVIVATSSLDSVISLGQKIAQAHSGFYRGGKAVNCTRYTNGEVTALINDVVYDDQYNNPKSLQVTVDLRELDISTDGEFTIVENYEKVIAVDVSPVDEKITFTAQVSSLGLSTYQLKPHFNRPYIATHEMQFLSEVSASSNWLNATLHTSEIPYSNIAYYYTSFSTEDWYAFHVTLNPDDFSEIILNAPYTDGSIDQNNIPFDSSEFPYLIFKVSSASISHYRWSVYNGTDWYHWFWYSNLTGEHVIDLHGYGQIQKLSLHIWGEPGDTIVLDYLKIVDCYPHFAAEVSIVSSRGAATYILNIPYSFKGKLDIGSYLVGTYAIPMKTAGTIEFQVNFEPWLGNLAVYAVTDRLAKASQVDNKKIFDFWISDSTGSGEITFYCGLLGEPKQYHNLTDLQYNEITKQATGKYVLASALKVTLSWEEIPAPILVAPEANQRFDPELEIQFAWTFTNQTAYQFQLGTDPEFTTILIDTGKVDSTEQHIIQQLPQTVQLYYWRVKCWNQYSFESPWSESRTVIVDRIKIIGGGIVDFTIDVDVGGKVWYYAVYEYDNATFDDSCGVLYVNGFEMTWDGEKWIYAFPYSTEGNQMTFHITGILDNQYELTAVVNQVGDITINWATVSVEIKK